METTVKTQHLNVNAIAVKQTRKQTAFWHEIEKYRFGIIPMLLVIVACTGGIAAAFGAKDDVLKLALIAFPTILTLGFTLAVAPMRLITWASAIAVILQMLTLIF